MNDVYQIFDNIPVTNAKTFRSYIKNYIAKFGESDLTNRIIEERYKKYIEYINSSDEYHLYEQKDIFCDMFFHESIDIVLPKLKRLINYYSSFGDTNDTVLMIYNSLCEVDDTDIIKKTINNPVGFNLIEIINTELKKAKRKSKIGIINALEEGSCVLIHKTNSIDESIWKERKDNISCSLVNEISCNQTWECGNYSLGFVVTDPDEIIAISAKDLDSEMKCNNLDEDFLTPNDLIKNTKHHNEIIITARYPSYVICNNGISQDDINASKSLGIPIFDLSLKSIVETAKDK